MSLWQMKLPCALLFALVFTPGFVLPGEPTSDGHGYTFGMYPFASPAQLLKTNAPLVKEFSRALGRAVHLRTKSTAEKFEEELEKKTYDIIFTSGIQYVYAHDKLGYQALARIDLPYRALLVVAVDSPMRTLHDLRGKTLGTAAPSQVGNVLARVALDEAGMRRGVDFRTRQFHDNYNCLHQLRFRSVDACVTSTVGLGFFRKRYGTSESIRVLLETTAIPNSVIAAHSRMPVKEREILARTIASWGQTEDGRRLLRETSYPPFTLASDSDYNVVREILKKVRR